VQIVPLQDHLAKEVDRCVADAVAIWLVAFAQIDADVIQCSLRDVFQIGVFQCLPNGFEVYLDAVLPVPVLP
jgi:hypothetical protein